jgi:hypothetical protein
VCCNTAHQTKEGISCVTSVRVARARHCHPAGFEPSKPEGCAAAMHAVSQLSAYAPTPNLHYIMHRPTPSYINHNGSASVAPRPQVHKYTQDTATQQPQSRFITAG